ncbi:MAG: hypothetical protein DRG63_07885 [Deltaproteobacteria bacterium]|nr:MAG: hypothetical protein DRG63_07885 [Deltaproteobacteria bacterium]
MELVNRAKRPTHPGPFPIEFERRLAKRHILPFSAYQAGLFVSDIVLAFLAFAGATYLALPAGYMAGWQILGSALVSAMVLISFFPVYRLYSYHLIYYKKSHFVTLVKSLSWYILMYAIICFLYKWPKLFEEHTLIVGAVIFLCASGLVVLTRFLSEHIGNFVMAVGISFIAVGLYGMIFGNEVYPLVQNPLAGGAAFLLAALSIFAVRYVLVDIVYSRLLKRHFRRQIVIIGTDEEAWRIGKYIVDTNAPFWVAGFLGPTSDEKQQMEACLPSKRRLGKLIDLPEVIETHGIHEIIVTDKDMDKGTLISLLDYCLSRRIVVWFPPSLLPIIPMKLYIDRFCTLPMIRLCVQRTPELFSALKRVVDLLLTGPLLVILSPVFLIIAAAIKLDSRGPVFYKAVAVGEGGRQFNMLKFRSMRPDGRSDLHKEFMKKFIKGEIPPEANKNGVLKITNDPRVTRVGRVLRRLSLDELPQLINVLKGDMSLVGPRPCLPYEYEMYKSWYRKRNSVRPGITGLWQVAGRSEVLFEDMILMDLYYIYNRNFMFDLAILFETIFVVLSKKGAW